jgi:hypothetical protein
MGNNVLWPDMLHKTCAIKQLGWLSARSAQQQYACGSSKLHSFSNEQLRMYAQAISIELMMTALFAMLAHLRGF